MYEIYTLLEGDTINSVADKFSTTDDILYQINGNMKDWKSGMQIIVPKRQDNNFIYYTVKKGDNLYDIAKKYDVDYKILLSLNGLDKDDYIYPNQTIVIPRDDLLAYITGSDDSIGRLMKEYNVGVEDFVKQNQEVFLKPEQIIFFRKK